MDEIEFKKRYWNFGGWLSYWLMWPFLIGSWFSPWLAIPALAALIMNAGCLIAWSRWSERGAKAYCAASQRSDAASATGSSEQDHDTSRHPVTERPTGTEARVCADIAARQRLGIAKYGTTVAENPLPP